MQRFTVKKDSTKAVKLGIKTLLNLHNLPKVIMSVRMRIKTQMKIILKIQTDSLIRLQLSKELTIFNLKCITVPKKDLAV